MRPLRTIIWQQIAMFSATAVLASAAAQVQLAPLTTSDSVSLQRCGNDNPDISISACTVLIQAGNEPPPILLAIIYRTRGDAYTLQERYDFAIDDYTKAIRLDPQRADAFYGRGNAYSGKESFDRAIKDYTQAVTLYPNYAAAFANRAAARFAKGQHEYRLGDGVEYDRAILDYDQAIKLNLNLASAFLNRGRVYFAKRLSDRAILEYDLAIKMKPNYPYAFLMRAHAHSQKSQHARAIQDYDQAIKLDPTFALAFYERGRTKELFLGDSVGGQADLRRWQQLSAQ